MQVLKKLNFHKINIALITLLVISLLFSKFMISVAQILLLISWLLEGEFKEKFKNIKSNKAVLFFLLYFIISLFGLIYTSDLKSGLNDIILKLPLLILPVIISSIKFNQKDTKIILYFFILAVFVKSLIDSSIFIINEFNDLRDLSFGLSHIRFSLMINLAFFSLIYFLTSGNFNLKKTEKVPIIIFLVWFLIFLFILQSLTGIVIFMVISYLLLIIEAIKSKNLKIKKIFILIVIFFTITVSLYSSYVIYDFYDVEKISFSDLDSITSKGNKYQHDTINITIENKNYVWLYVCQEELRNEWNKKSKIKYDSIGSNGYEIKYTLIRYLNSKGLRKDAEGFSKLDQQDIINIENGIANYLDSNNLNLSNKIYKIIWQIDLYFKTGNSNGYSVAQRFEYLKTGWEIFIDNPVIGVGTGDIKSSFDKQYIKNNARLDQKYRRISHNQYLTDLVKYGIIGFSISMIALFYPFIKKRKYKHFLPLVFFSILCLSMLNEDTLQTQLGITFCSIFYCLIILSDSFIDNNYKDNLKTGKTS